MQDTLGLTFDQAYLWTFLVDKYGHTIMNIKGIHNTAVDIISKLNDRPIKDDLSTYVTFTQYLCYYNIAPDPRSAIYFCIPVAHQNDKESYLQVSECMGEYNKPTK